MKTAISEFLADGDGGRASELCKDACVVCGIGAVQKTFRCSSTERHSMLLVNRTSDALAGANADLLLLALLASSGDCIKKFSTSRAISFS